MINYLGYAILFVVFEIAFGILIGKCIKSAKKLRAIDE